MCMIWQGKVSNSKMGQKHTGKGTGYGGTETTAELRAKSAVELRIRGHMKWVSGTKAPEELLRCLEFVKMLSGAPVHTELLEHLIAGGAKHRSARGITFVTRGVEVMT